MPSEATQRKSGVEVFLIEKPWKAVKTLIREHTSFPDELSGSCSRSLGGMAWRALHQAGRSPWEHVPLASARLKLLYCEHHVALVSSSGHSTDMVHALLVDRLEILFCFSYLCRRTLR